MMIFFLMQLAVKPLGRALGALELKKNMADPYLFEHRHNLPAQWFKIAQFLVVHPYMSGKSNPTVGEGTDVNVMNAEHIRE